MQSSHPILDQVHGGVHQAENFVDDCQAVVASRSEELKAKQWQELKSTLEYALEKEI